MPETPEITQPTDTSIADNVLSASPSQTVFRNEFGKEINISGNFSEDAQARYNELIRQRETTYDEDEIANLDRDIQELLDQQFQNNQTYLQSAEMQEAEQVASKTLSSWDPRLARVDAFYMNDSQNAPVVVPFSSVTAASSFEDLVFTLPGKTAELAYRKMQEQTTADGTKIAQGTPTSLMTTDLQAPVTNTADGEKSDTGGNTIIQSKGNLSGAAQVPFDVDVYEQDPLFYGTTSLMNPYSLTKLVGSLELDSPGNVTKNYMYDVRDQRRFYGLSVDADSDFLTVSDPTVSNIIKWSNADRWGRTPYTYQDFVYCKWFGIIPNNRLITLRRYHAPTYDNLNFEGMEKVPGREETKYFAPRTTVVTYMGEDTGNTLSDIFKFSTGIVWTDVKSDIWSVEGNDAQDPQGTIDQMFDGNGGFTGAENPMFNSIVQSGNTLTGKILSFGKFALGLKQDSFGISQGAFDQLSKMNVDPYENGTYQNRIKGPLDRIDTVKRRDAGITFEQTFQIKCTYVAKSIGGINPKAAILDIMNNCLEMVSPDAVFWGGGHRFNIKPSVYPFHDGGWRDSFMKKLYDGKIFGQNGALSTILSGVKKFGASNSQGKDEGIWSNITDKFKQYLGEGLGAIGSVVSSVAGALFGESSGNFINNFVKGAVGEDAAEDGKKKMNGLLGNLNTLWRNKVLETTLMPSINAMNSLLIGEPVGEWHMTVGNPLNPIMTIGNLICSKMDVNCSDDLGPDDFPNEITVTYTLEHGMPRDKASIQSMFNRGMGKSYDLPDYIKSASQYETKVDHYTGGVFFREPAFIQNTRMLAQGMAANGYHNVSTFQNYQVDPGKVINNVGKNPATTLITKFTPINTDSDITGNDFTSLASPSSNLPVLRSLAITRQYTS